MALFASSPMPVFPLRTAPDCRKCARKCVREARGKRYCYCCACDGSTKQTVWCTWDDSVGVNSGNPLCDCGLFSRRDYRKSGTSFETCAIGKCSMKGSKKSPYTPSTQQGTPTSPKSPAPAPPLQKASQAAAAAAAVAAIVGASPWVAPVPGYTPAPFSSYLPSPPSSSSGLSSASLPNRSPDEEYIRLMEHVFHTAQKTAFPSKNLNMGDVAKALHQQQTAPAAAKPAPSSFRIRSATEFEKHSKIGAVGELFVFTFLQRFLDKDIYLSDWKSNMRNHIKEHPRFQEWPDWAGAETSDIVFPDDNGALTRLFIQHGHLDGARWAGQKPEYFIEVKSTMSQRNREFYMSPDQFSRMQSMARPAPTSSAPSRPKIYLIARVSNMQESDIQLRFYIDPETLRGQSKLRFRQVWVVEDVS